MDKALIELVEGAAKARGDEPVPRDFITEVLQKVETGRIRISTYPGGMPSLSDVYEKAKSLFEHSKAVI